MVCDFESDVIDAVKLKAVLGLHVAIQGCVYHLCQCTYCRVQELGFATAYATNNHLFLLRGMLDGRTGVATRVPSKSGMEYLRGVAPALDGVARLLDYFGATYVNGTEQLSFRLRRIPPAFPRFHRSGMCITFSKVAMYARELEQRFSSARRSLPPRCLV